MASCAGFSVVCNRCAVCDRSWNAVRCRHLRTVAAVTPKRCISVLTGSSLAAISARIKGVVRACWCRAIIIKAALQDNRSLHPPPGGGEPHAPRIAEDDLPRYNRPGCDSYKGIEQRTPVKFYFATPHHSWERGTNENTNGLIRQYLPKGTSMAGLTQHLCNTIAHKLNTRPRKRLDFKTPLECFHAN